MSFNRENVIWQSPDGTWNRAFFDHYSTASYDDDDYDPEWDVEYTDSFEWVSTGHSTKSQAERSWGGANPGGQSTYEFGDDTKDDIAEFELQAALAHRAGMQYRGPVKNIPVSWLAEQYANAMTHDASHRVRGYANTTTADIPAMESELQQRLSTATNEERQQASQALRDAGQALEDTIGKIRRPRSRWDTPYPTAAAEQARGVIKQLDKSAKRMTRSAAPVENPERRKTSPGSTAGSFAPKTHSAPEINLS